MDRRRGERRHQPDRRHAVNLHWAEHNPERRRFGRRESDRVTVIRRDRRTGGTDAGRRGRGAAAASRAPGLRTTEARRMPAVARLDSGSNAELAPEILDPPPPELADEPVTPDIVPAAERETIPQAPAAEAPAADTPAADKSDLVWLLSPRESVDLMRASRAHLRALDVGRSSGPTPTPVQPAAPAAVTTPSTPDRSPDRPPAAPPAAPPPVRAGHAPAPARPPRRQSGPRQLVLEVRHLVIAAGVIGIATVGYFAGRTGRGGAVPAAARTETAAAPATSDPATPAVSAPAQPLPAQTVPATTTPPTEEGARAAAAPPLAAPRTAQTPSGRDAAAQPTRQEPAQAVPAAAAAAPSAAQPAPQTPPAPTTGAVRGVVRDPNGRGVSGARVTVRGTALTATTDAAGNFEIADVPQGAATLQASATGFVAASSDVSVTPGGSVAATIALAAVPTASEPDRELSTGGWSAVSRSEAAELFGGGFGAIEGLPIESIARQVTGSRARLRVVQLTATGDRIILTETRSSAARNNAPAVVTAIRVLPPSEAFPYSTGTVSLGGYLITARSSIDTDALRALLERLREVR